MDLTAAPVDLTINGTVYSAYPLRDRDHEEFNKWIRREYLKRVRESTDDPAILRLAARDASTMMWMSLPGRDVAMTVEGMAKLASLLCRVKFTAKDVMDYKTLDDIMDVFHDLHFPDGPKDEEPPKEDSGEEPQGN